MQRKYVWIAYTVEADGVTATVQYIGKRRADVDNLIGLAFEGPVPADIYPLGKTFKLADEAAV